MAQSSDPPPSLARDTALVGAAAALSRVLGFARDVMIAALIGAGPAADALLAALRIPNLVRRVVGEGAVNGAFVPVYRRMAAESGDAAARRFAGEALAAVGLAGLALTALGEIAAPWLTLALAGGFAHDGERLALAASLTRLSLPLAVFATMAALCAAMLAGQGRLRWAALAPVVVNAVLVAVLAFLAGVGEDEARLAWIVAVAVSGAGLLQLLLVGAALLRRSERPSLTWPRLSPGLRAFGGLALPGLATAASAQLSILAALNLASAEPSALAQLHYADRLFQLPLGFVAAGAGVVLLNEVVRLLRAGHTGQVAPLLDKALLAALLLALPAAAGLAVLADPIASILFERGAFSPNDTAAVAAVIRGLAPGLPAAALARVLAQPFMAQERSRPPLLGAVAGFVVTVSAGLVLRDGHGVAGLGAAVSLGAWADAGVLALALGAAGLWRPAPRLLVRLALAALSAALMALAVREAQGVLAAALATEARLPVRVAALGALCGGGAAAYAAALLACGAGRWRGPAAT
ncbi:murein biosynthesis integral membrane protein MurJ [Alsobacter soli]|uniref:Probable lipid II flippase MurJ n=1 Tax=Alsobacter soli TaxID=2109933 RepID=A0A2T1HT39_9HYPH|nr:murein biosynthesis integral membrane protein MurJ [Alsobacter soli]PSC04812.1 murein biosynthesis integral membrane protein MurJ [Alsobacter soli]